MAAGWDGPEIQRDVPGNVASESVGMINVARYTLSTGEARQGRGENSVANYGIRASVGGSSDKRKATSQTGRR